MGGYKIGLEMMGMLLMMFVEIVGISGVDLSMVLKELIFGVEVV